MNVEVQMCGHKKEDLVYGHLSDWIVKSVEFRNFVRMPSSQAALGGRSREGCVQMELMVNVTSC